MSIRFSTGMWLFSNATDRYCTEGYRDVPRTQDILAAIAKLKTIRGVEVRQTDVTPEMPIKEWRRLLKEHSLVCSGVTASLAHTRKFALSAFGHQHQKTRNAAIDEGRKAVDIARQLAATEVTLRLYTDGFDYPFQVDYGTHWNTLISSIKTIAKYASPDINVAIAYKAQEPRRSLTISNVGKALSMCQEIAMKNVGVSLNIGHALQAGENPAESIAFLTRSNKLFQLYFADAIGTWDDLLMPGSQNLWETMEALFYLKLAKYKGFITLDMLPQRMEPLHALQIAVGNLAILWKKLEKLDPAELKKAQRTLDATESQRIIRRVMMQA